MTHIKALWERICEYLSWEEPGERGGSFQGSFSATEKIQLQFYTHSYSCKRIDTDVDKEFQEEDEY